MRRDGRGRASAAAVWAGLLVLWEGGTWAASPTSRPSTGTRWSPPPRLLPPPSCPGPSSTLAPPPFLSSIRSGMQRTPLPRIAAARSGVKGRGYLRTRGLTCSCRSSPPCFWTLQEERGGGRSSWFQASNSLSAAPANQEMKEWLPWQLEEEEELQTGTFSAGVISSSWCAACSSRFFCRFSQEPSSPGYLVLLQRRSFLSEGTRCFF